ncbi:MAG: adenylate/guanylate cyclase domain-containing protein [Chloroflexota bacterium]
MSRPPSSRTIALAWLVGTALSVAASSLSAANGRPPEVFLPAGVSGTVYVTSGFFMARRRPDNRIGYLLMLAAVVAVTPVVVRYLFLPAEAFNVAVGPGSSLLIAYVLLSFPSGRLAGRAERLTLGAITAFFILFAVATIFTVEPALHGTSRCPPCEPNPFRLTDPSVFPAIQPASFLGVVISALAVSVLRVRRWASAHGAARRMLAPVLFGGIVIGLGLATTSVVYLTGTPVPLAPQFDLVLRLLVPIGLAVTFISVYAARAAVAGAVVQLGASPSAEGLESALRRALRDPDLVVARWSEVAAAYLNREGAHLDLDALDARRNVLRLERDGRPLAAVIHDAALGVDPALVTAVADAVRFAVDTTDLQDRLRASGGDASSLPRGTVAFLFGDLEGSTELLAKLGDAYVDVLVELRRIIREAADRHGGRVVDARADECFLVFADPPTSVPAAIEIQRRLAEARWPDGVQPHLRIGLHVGTPNLTADGYVGLDVHLAARVMSAANGEQIVASGPVADSAADHLPLGTTFLPLGSFRLRGIPEPVDLYRISAPGLERDTPPRAEAA